MLEKQAAAISAAVSAVHETADLATKANLREVETAIRHDMGKMERGQMPRLIALIL